MEVEQYGNSNQGENLLNICHPGDNVPVRVLLSEKRKRKEDTCGGDELAEENTGKVQTRQDTEQGDQKGAETRDYIDRQNQDKKADMVGARNKD